MKILSRELIDAGRHLEAHVEEEFFTFFGHVKGVLMRGIDSGEFRLVNPHATHISLVGGVVWFALTAPLRERLAHEGGSPAPSPTLSYYIDHFREFTLRGLARSGPDPLDSETEKWRSS